MKIVVLDRPRELENELDWSPLEALGSVTFYASSPQDTVIDRIKDAEIVLVNKAHITREVLDSCPNIRFISIIATGYNIVDIEAAAEKGILVSNVPSYGSAAIAQHAIALLLEVTNRVGHLDAEVRKGRKNNATDWCFWDSSIIELADKTIGIVGLGRIGKYVAEIAKAFGMQVIAYDTYAQEDAALRDQFRFVSLDELLEQSDVISLHCPLTEQTAGMIGSEAIQKMKNGAILINNSRGGLIDEKAVADALCSGKLSAAGLDTVPVEPIPQDSPLLSAPNCYITPHISWAALECRTRLKDTAIRNVEAFLNGKPENIVNR